MPVSKILVVDDEPDLQSLIKQKFRKEIKDNDYDFTFAGNGVQALKKIDEDSTIELVLADINMPEMDGLTLLAKIKELNNPLLHSVIVSAYGDIKNIRTAMNGGAFDFVVKPIDFIDLKITIEKAINNLETLKKALEARDKLVAVQSELEEARQLQLSMLPANLPSISNLDIAVHMQTATEVGGDYYDFRVSSDGTLNVALGDATGHGMQAGTLVTIMKGIFTLEAECNDVLPFFQKSVRAIKEIKLGRLMMAFTLLKIKDSLLSLSNAGVPPVYIFRQGKNEVEEIDNKGMPLGAVNDFPYKESKTELMTGDVILLLSDGFPELQNKNKEAFGYKRVIESFKESANQSAEKIIDHLKNKVNEWIDGNDPGDDVTFVVIKIK
jgi:sigma-B regulation protein RsbU (phosphoserine phosphatase)